MDIGTCRCESSLGVWKWNTNCPIHKSNPLEETMENENSALRDAITALKDFVEGKRHDTENISEILNGALRLPHLNG